MDSLEFQTSYSTFSNKNNSSTQKYRTNSLGRKEKIPMKMVKSKLQPQQQIPKIKSSIQVVQQQPVKNIINNQYLMKEYKMNSNIAFISSLIQIHSNYFHRYTQKSSLKLNKNYIWLIVSGTVKFICHNRKQFTVKDGFLFFMSFSFLLKVQNIVSLTNLVLLKIPRDIFAKNISQPLYIKNKQKIKLLKKIKFLQKWDQFLFHDVASSIELIQIDQDRIIYHHDDEIDYLYILKEGVVLLQRNFPISDPHFLSYESEFDQSSPTENQNRLTIKKSMCFGIDGLFIKHGKGRLYSAKALNDCAIYRIKANLLQAIYDEKQQEQKNSQLSGKSTSLYFTERIPSKQLLRMRDNYTCLQTNQKLIQKRSLTKVQIGREIKQKINNINYEQKKNIEEIHNHQKKVRKLNIATQFNKSKIHTRINSKSSFEQKFTKGPEITFLNQKKNLLFSSNILNKNTMMSATTTPKNKNKLGTFMTRIMQQQDQIMKQKQYLNYKKQIQDKLTKKLTQINNKDSQQLSIVIKYLKQQTKAAGASERLQLDMPKQNKNNKKKQIPFNNFVLKKIST